MKKLKCPCCGSEKVDLAWDSCQTKKTYYRCLKCQELFTKEEGGYYVNAM